MNATMVIMQGPPGSGKSTVARDISAKTGAAVLSTDDFHNDGQNDGYLYRPLDVPWFHAWNQWQADQLLAEGRGVVIDNTNILRAWAQPYLDSAKRHGAQVLVVRCTERFPNSHGVPESTVKWMREHVEDLLP